MLEYPNETQLQEEAIAQQPESSGPPIPQTLEETGLSPILLEDLILKLLLNKGVLSGREIADEICLPFKIIQPLMSDMKARMLVSHRTTATLGDFYYILTEQGKQTAILAKEYCAYVGPAPVVFEDYLESISFQSIRNEAPRIEDLRRAYSDIIVSDEVLDIIGPAINSGRGIFLFGEPGNGKTTIAERIRNCFRNDIYIPRTLWIEGEIVRLYDPQCHEALPVDENERFDHRWIKIKRPAVVVGGELTMESLDIKYSKTLKISEAPLQMKANCGTFLIDDFGRQRIDHRELLNRWIIPLEKRYDFLLLPNGKKIQVPFDELIIFSTNLNPKDLVDDAFLRRIPYKVEIISPNETEFRALFRYQCQRDGIPYEDEMVTYLIENHYRGKRGFRVCHARDILDQVLNSASYINTDPKMTPELLDIACKNYFSAMECSYHGGS